MFKKYFKSLKLNQLLILTLFSSLFTLWIKLADADVIVADEGGSALMKYSRCGLLTNDSEMTIYYGNKSQNELKLLYTLSIKENRSLLHLESRAGLYIESDHMTLHIQSLKISDTGFYEFGVDGTGCKETNILKVQGTPVLKINNTDLGGIANLPEGGIGNIICEKEGTSSSAMAVKLNEQILSGTTEYSPSKVNDFYLDTVTLQISHKFTIEDADKMLVCSSNDSKLERKVTIDITVNPTVSITKISSIKAGEEVTIICTCRGRPATEMHWLKNKAELKGENKKPIFEGKLVKVENHLKFSPNIADNKKILSCVTVNSMSKDEITLDVTYAPILSLTANATEITENSTIHFKCDVNANPPPSNVIWMKDGTTFTDYTTKNTESLTIENVNRRHRGQYSCKAENTDGTKESTKLDLRVKYPPVAMLTVNGYNDSHQLVSQNTKVILICITLDAYPENTTLAFYKNDTPLKVVNNGLMLSKSDSDMYSCKLTNDLGSGQSQVFINVTYAPENATVSSTSVDVKNGSLIKDVTCSGNANPEPIFQWMFKGIAISQGHQLSFNRTLTLNDDGEYSCKVFNSYGSQTANLKINVLYAPICTHSVKHTKYRLKPLKLICSIDSKPRPTYFIWFNNEDKEKVIGSSDTIDVTYDGNSTYYCEAQNSEGVSSPRCEFQIHYSDVAVTSDITQIVVPVVIVLLTLLLASIIIIIIIRRRNSKAKGHVGYELNQNERNSPGSDIINTSDNTPNPSEEITYQNVGRVDEAVYQTVDKPQKPPPPKKKNPDGVIYADLEISRPKNGPSNTKPERKEQPTEYAIIDFTKKVPPVEAAKKPEPIYCNSTTIADTNGQAKSPQPAAPPRRQLQSNV